MSGIIKCPALGCQSTNVTPFGTGSTIVNDEGRAKVTCSTNTSYHCRDCGCYFPIKPEIVIPYIGDVSVEDRHKE